MTTIINLLLINAIVALVYLSGFWDTMDYYISQKWKFHHLPHIFTCCLCQTWWLSLLYIIIAGKFTLLWIAASLFNAYLVDATIALFTVIKNWIMALIKVLIP